MIRSSRYRLTWIVFSGVVVASSCTADTPPTSLSQESRAIEASSAFVPSASQLRSGPIGVADSSVAIVTLDPGTDNTITVGSNRLVVPAGAVCDLATTRYGVDSWNQPCSPQTQPFTVAMVSRANASGSPRVDFAPALRFSPDKRTMLYMYTRHAVKTALNLRILYCTSVPGSVCVDESTTDADLRTYVDPTSGVVFRRIKHFSGYVVAE